MSNSGLDRSEQLELLDKYKEELEDQDYGYLKCVLFPELSDPCRVPTQFAMPSALFTHRFTCYINTGLTGNGVIQFAPKDTTFYCLAVNDPLTAYSGNPTNSKINMQYLLPSDGRYITANFA